MLPYMLTCALCTMMQEIPPHRINVPPYATQQPVKRDRKLEWQLLHPKPGALE